jgi:hypothetical protein
MPGSVIVNPGAPIGVWTRAAAFDTASACEAGATSEYQTGPFLCSEIRNENSTLTPILSSQPRGNLTRVRHVSPPTTHAWRETRDNRPLNFGPEPPI